MYVSIVKPLFDFLIALTLGVFVFPLCLIISLVLFVEHNGKVFFIQERAKKGGGAFSIIKFRTLLEINTEEAGSDEYHLTKFGNFLRSTSLDELPQLLNVLKGDMSLIGPRPLFMKYNEKYTKTHKQRLDVKPGITGWAQIHGGNELTWEQKFDLDVWYVANMSFIVDINILFRTISYLFFNIDLKSKTHMSAKEFKGNLNTEG